jgi:UDPglucose--hexose-1-phosphate uridylyltransferase
VGRGGEGGTMDQRLMFTVEPITARFIAPEGEEVERTIEIRTSPITFRTSRVTLSRIGEKEKGMETLPDTPPDANRKADCPFCRPQVMTKTPRCLQDFAPSGRLVRGSSLLILFFLSYIP